ncbi:hypothetical protein GGX14DRAFT_588307 [Mycena pura]|uniref:GH16 domain-containing protein n=1 Tax=Mycena pura TaxID=153505 RepID=A0AAD6USI6_9AGAR|nr:hypothetical protein GGX14DRAFT_588307 [Mycena pura]
MFPTLLDVGGCVAGLLAGLEAPELFGMYFYWHVRKAGAANFLRTTSTHSATARASGELRSWVHLCTPFPVTCAVETGRLRPTMKQRHHNARRSTAADSRGLRNMGGVWRAEPAGGGVPTLSGTTGALRNDARERTAALAGEPAELPVTHVVGTRQLRAQTAAPSRHTAAPPNTLRDNAGVQSPALAGSPACTLSCCACGGNHPAVPRPGGSAVPTFSGNAVRNNAGTRSSALAAMCARISSIARVPEIGWLRASTIRRRLDHTAPPSRRAPAPPRHAARQPLLCPPEIGWLRASTIRRRHPAVRRHHPDTLRDNLCTRARTHSRCACGGNGQAVHPVQSARLTTFRNVMLSSGKLRYGRIEVRAKMPVGDWLWPALWMLPVDSVCGN